MTIVCNKLSGMTFEGGGGGAKAKSPVDRGRGWGGVAKVLSTGRGLGGTESRVLSKKAVG